MSCPPLRLATVVESFGAALRQRQGPLPGHQHRALEAIVSCRTEQLGGRRWDCPRCGHHHFVYHSCRNRHCPRCQSGRQQAWLRARLQELPAVGYHHVVFTLPEPLARCHRHAPEGLYRVLFAAANQTLSAFARRRGLQLGMIGVLHTWGRNLHYHPHVHFLVTAGGWEERTGRWHPLKKYLFEARSLARVYRAKVFAQLEKQKLSLPAQPLPKHWHVYVTAPRGDPRSLLLYLARYVSKVALDERRLEAIDTRAGTVTFRYRDWRDGRTKRLTLDAVEFLRRFLDHILPKAFVKIRHYGIFAHGVKKRLLPLVKEALQLAGQQVRATLWCLEALLATITPPEAVPSCPRCGQPMSGREIPALPRPEHPP